MIPFVEHCYELIVFVTDGVVREIGEFSFSVDCYEIINNFLCVRGLAVGDN